MLFHRRFLLHDRSSATQPILAVQLTRLNNAILWGLRFSRRAVYEAVPPSPLLDGLLVGLVCFLVWEEIVVDVGEQLIVPRALDPFPALRDPEPVA